MLGHRHDGRSAHCLPSAAQSHATDQPFLSSACIQSSSSSGSKFSSNCLRYTVLTWYDRETGAIPVSGKQKLSETTGPVNFRSLPLPVLPKTCMKSSGLVLLRQNARSPPLVPYSLHGFFNFPATKKQPCVTRIRNAVAPSGRSPDSILVLSFLARPKRYLKSKYLLIIPHLFPDWDGNIPPF